MSFPRRPRQVAQPQGPGDGGRRLYREVGVGSDGGQASSWQTTLYTAENSLKRHNLKAVSKPPSPTVRHPDYTSLNLTPMAEPTFVAA